jgi:murein DD-endopeptidase MepM/ murein hydrolase activator NlpD
LLGLGVVDVPLPTPTAGQAQSPIYPLVVGNNGGYRAVRSSPAQGACGVHGYPCQHPGLDVNGVAGTRVVAPESGVVVAASDGNSAPWVGYGPWLIVIQGASGNFHLLGHLEPAYASMAGVGARVTAGQLVGATSSANHTHWEVRQKLTPGAGRTNLDNNLDPLEWLGGGSSSALAALLLLGGAAAFAYLYWRSRG